MSQETTVEYGAVSWGLRQKCWMAKSKAVDKRVTRIGKDGAHAGPEGCDRCKG